MGHFLTDLTHEKEWLILDFFKYETVLLSWTKRRLLKMSTAAKITEVATQIAAGMIICTQLKKINTKGINPNRAL